MARCRSPLDGRADGGLEIVEAGPQRQQRGDPQHARGRSQVTPGTIWSPAGPASSTPSAIICMVVFHLASCVTCTLTLSSARNSRRPDTRISRHRMMTAAQICRPVDGVVVRQHQQRGADQQLVGDRVEHAPERRLLLPDAGQIAVQPVGEAGADVDGQRPPAAGVAGAEEEARARRPAPPGCAHRSARWAGSPTSRPMSWRVPLGRQEHLRPAPSMAGRWAK